MATRYSSSRQKACRSCADAKAKCDRDPSRCNRCRLRGLDCSYVTVHRASELTADYDEIAASAPSTPITRTPGSSNDQINTAPGFASSTRNDETSSTHRVSPLSFHAQHGQQLTQSWVDATPNASSPATRSDLNFSSLDLVCPIQADDIRNRWLNTYVPVPGQAIKAYPQNVSTFIFRALKSYAAVSIRGNAAPPFVHPLHLLVEVGNNPLSTCLSIVRVCHQPLPGSESAAAVIIRQEMARIYDNVASYSNVSILFAFQAYLIYSMVLFFHLGSGSDPFLREAMVNLQDLACSCSREGLVCTSEQLRARPRWEAWTVAEAKRRTLFTMCLFDSVLASNDGLPTFIATELRGLPASAGKYLWHSQSKQAWEAEYNQYLAQWPTSSLQIEELWPIPDDMDIDEVVKRRQRVDHWLEDADEFCMMLYAVTGCTHGG